ncbi:MAG: hypothetical protein ACK5PQ_04450 [Alphaproteobacteria bacterium]
MIIKNILLFIFFLGCFHLYGASSSDIQKDPGEDLYPHILKVDNRLYFAKMKSHDLYLAMERVDSINHALWKKYAEVQSNPRVTGWAKALVNKDGSPRQKGSIADGACHFLLALTSTNFSSNEVWAAYVTGSKEAQHIPDSITSYSGARILEGSCEFAKNIKMYVSVTSSATALVTSHMGVAVSAEGVQSGRPKGISVPLHSFAAQVMKRRNPERRYMLNAPVMAMERILIKGLPKGSVFVGTREMQPELEKDASRVWKGFLQDNPGIEEKKSEPIRCRAERDLTSQIGYREEMLRGEENEEERNRINKECQDFVNRDSSFLEMLPDGSLQISESKIKARIKKKMEEAFKAYQISKAASKGEDIQMETLKLMKEHPPLLSVDDVYNIENWFTLYDQRFPDKKWLHVKKENPDYNWCFESRAFEPAGVTHYVVTDLSALADAAPVNKV